MKISFFSASKWLVDFPQLNNFDVNKWSNIFTIPFNVTRETKLQSFQYKLIHRVIPCNKWLHMVNIKANDKCVYCKSNTTDDLLHFFINCKKVKQFWIDFVHWWNRLAEVKIQPNMDEIHEIILFGLPIQSDPIKVLNHCLIIAKFYIHRQRLFHNNDIDFHVFLSELKLKFYIEECICIKELRPDKFDKYRFISENI